MLQASGLSDYFEQLAQGKVANRSSIYKFGRVICLGASIRIPMWDGNANYIFPVTANTVTVTSDDIADAPAGIGARSVHIYGLDENWEEINEIITLGATSTKTFIRVYRAHVEESGTSDFPYDSTKIGNNKGTITITHNGTTSPIAVILPGLGQTLMAIFTIPVGYKALMWAAGTNNGKNNDAIGHLYSRDNTIVNAPWRCRGIRDMYRNLVNKTWRIPRVYTEKTDILFAISSTNGDTVSGTFELEMVKLT